MKQITLQFKCISITELEHNWKIKFATKGSLDHRFNMHLKKNAPEVALFKPGQHYSFILDQSLLNDNIAFAANNPKIEDFHATQKELGKNHFPNIPVANNPNGGDAVVTCDPAIDNWVEEASHVKEIKADPFQGFKNWNTGHQVNSPEFEENMKKAVEKEEKLNPFNDLPGQ